MTALDRRQDPRNHVLRNLATDRRLTAELVVDRQHPFFFDHPLDHVPGLLLLEGATQLAQSDARRPQFVGSVTARFEKYALFNETIDLSADRTEASGRTRYDVALAQDGRTRAHVSVELVDFDRDFAGRCARRAEVHPCPPGPLNKSNPENVLISEPQVTASSVRAHILSASGNCLLTDSICTVHPLFMLECFMQVQRYLNAQHPDPGRMRDILTGVTFSQILPVRDSSLPMTVEGTADFMFSQNGRASRTANIAVCGSTFAHCSILTARTGMRRKSA
ncbi:AfsA-related hotdog domain-containing protein [Roseibium sp. Sym1]|uniref:AfsA-related hotdog domain-containing protein n=1 Tax=Roseibium sp. Sym1 TaxID=3016006 RepID=UPI0022B46FB5|nr:AfsA-related hotdog domain-containing protein [Roseibium sp. Sym1]